LLSQFPGCLDDAHNLGHLLCHLFVNQLFVDVRDEEMVDGGLRLFAVFADDKLHVLVHHISDIGNNRAHKDVDLKQHVEQHVETHFHVDVVNFSFYSGSVEPHVPVSQILQKFDQRRDHIIKLVFSLFSPNISDEILKSRLNPFVSNIVML
jgi:hypothetical protein